MQVSLQIFLSVSLQSRFSRACLIPATAVASLAWGPVQSCGSLLALLHATMLALSGNTLLAVGSWAFWHGRCSRTTPTEPKAVAPRGPINWESLLPRTPMLWQTVNPDHQGTRKRGLCAEGWQAAAGRFSRPDCFIIPELKKYLVWKTSASLVWKPSYQSCSFSKYALSHGF